MYHSNTIGIIGTGRLTKFIVSGISKVESPYKFVLSPGSSKKASNIKNKFSVDIADDNQDVINQCDLILLSLPISKSFKILENLKFRPGNTILSAIGGLSQSSLKNVANIKSVHTTMMPGYANSFNKGPCILYPESHTWNNFLSYLGPVFTCKSEEEFTTASIIGAVSGVSFEFNRMIINWFAKNGLKASFAKELVLKTLMANIELTEGSELSIEEIIENVTTPNGMTANLINNLSEKNALDIWEESLTKILKNNN